METRHQELLRTQKQLQERYDRLQKIHGPQFIPAPVGGAALPQTGDDTGSVNSTAAIETLSAQTAASSHNSAENQLESAAAAAVVGNQLNNDDDPHSSTDEQSSTTSSARTEIECNKGRDHLFISLLLDSSHETDIL